MVRRLVEHELITKLQVGLVFCTWLYKLLCYCYIGRLKTVANVVLLALMAGAGYTLWELNEDLQHFTGTLVFGLLLACRLVIQMQNTAVPASTRTKIE